MAFSTIPVRFFVFDPEVDELEVKEVSEHEWLKAEGLISYERHTIRENGASQICLTKGLPC
jgi:hypothetical protein